MSTSLPRHLGSSKASGDGPKPRRPSKSLEPEQVAKKAIATLGASLAKSGHPSLQSKE